MQLRDMPYYHHFSKVEQHRSKRMPQNDQPVENVKVVQGTEEHIRKKLGKFIKPK
jgi:hypothetical protein